MAGRRGVLEVQRLSLTYRVGEKGRVRALHEVCLAIRPGEAVGILGESGCGKSTLARTLLGLLPPRAEVSGSIWLGEHDLLRLQESELQRVRGSEISLVPQEPALALSPVLRAGEQIVDVLRAHTRMSRQRCRSHAEALLAQVGLADAARIYDAFPHQLSGGQRQRVAIAQAIACGPRLLIADEPTTALDTTTQAEILALLSQLQRQHGMALIAISHDVAVLAELVDRIIVMRGGEIVEEDGVDQIVSSPSCDYTRGLVQGIAIPMGVAQ